MTKEKKSSTLFSVACNFSVSLLLASIKIFFILIFTLGSISSFRLYSELYPKDAVFLYELFNPVFMIVYQLIKVSIIIFIVVVVVCIIYKLMKGVLTKDKERMQKKRTQFIKDIVNELKNPKK